LIERWATTRGKEMAELLAAKFGYELGKTVFQFEDKIGGHTEEAWCYQFEVFVKHFY
jgi:hypothetical protein